MCVTREEFTLIFNHCLMLPKYVSDDEGNGVVVTLSQTIVGSVEQKWFETVRYTTVCLPWPLVFSCAHLDGRPDICRAKLQLCEFLLFPYICHWHGYRFPMKSPFL